MFLYFGKCVYLLSWNYMKLQPLHTTAPLLIYNKNLESLDYASCIYCVRFKLSLYIAIFWDTGWRKRPGAMKFTTCGCFLGLTSPSNPPRVAATPCVHHATGTVKKLTISEPREHFTMGVTNSRRKPSQCSSPGNQCLGRGTWWTSRAMGMGKMGKRVVGWCCGINVN